MYSPQLHYAQSFQSTSVYTPVCYYNVTCHSNETLTGVEAIEAERNQRNSLFYGLGHGLSKVYHHLSKYITNQVYGRWDSALDDHIKKYNSTNNDRVNFLADYEPLEPAMRKQSQARKYQDKKGDQWIIKKPQQDSWNYGFKEYIASGIYQYLLGTNTPTMTLVFDTEALHGNIRFGSKVIENFEPLYKYESSIESDGSENNCQLEDDVDFLGIGHTIHSMPVLNYQRTTATMVFACDTDSHNGNVGVIQQDVTYNAAKIDHGFAFIEWHCKKGDLLARMNYMYSKNFDNFYHGIFGHFVTNLDEDFNIFNTRKLHLQCHGYQNLKREIYRIAHISFQDLESIVNQKCEEITPYLHQYHQFLSRYDNMKNPFLWRFTVLPDLMDNYGFDLDELRVQILQMLKHRLGQFKKLSQQMELEDAIYHNDQATALNLINDFKMTKPIKAFHLMYNGADLSTRPEKIRKSPEALAIQYGHSDLAEHIHRLTRCL